MKKENLVTDGTPPRKYYVCGIKESREVFFTRAIHIDRIVKLLSKLKLLPQIDRGYIREEERSIDYYWITNE